VELTFYGISSGNPRRANGTRQEASNDNDRFATNYARTQWWCPRYRPRPPLGERMIADSGERSGHLLADQGEYAREQESAPPGRKGCGGAALLKLKKEKKERDAAMTIYQAALINYDERPTLWGRQKLAYRRLPRAGGGRREFSPDFPLDRTAGVNAGHQPRRCLGSGARTST